MRGPAVRTPFTARRHGLARRVVGATPTPKGDPNGHGAYTEVATMTMKHALQFVFAISLFGVAFSGSLTYREFTGATALSCPSPGAPGTIFGYPACVYGLIMYTIIAVISGSALFRGSSPEHSHA
jgi:hypothetical protein